MHRALYFAAGIVASWGGDAILFGHNWTAVAHLGLAAVTVFLGYLLETEGEI